MKDLLDIVRGLLLIGKFLLQDVIEDLQYRAQKEKKLRRIKVNYRSEIPKTFTGIVKHHPFGPTETYRGGQLHSFDDMPAVVWPCKERQMWYKNGQLHRDNGKPAIIFENNEEAYYINDKEVIKEIAETYRDFFPEDKNNK